MNKKQWIASAVATMSAIALGTSLSFANSLSGTVSVNHAAYLRMGPSIYDSRITLEMKGSQLTLEPGSTLNWWHVQDSNGYRGYLIRQPYWTSVSYGTSAATNQNVSNSTNNVTNGTAGTLNQVSSSQLPPGVTYDPSVGALAPLSTSYQTKFSAVMQIADSKLGTPYIWGHNEDRGQYGFDCSNFTSYVYHHALGYKMSGASQTQYHSVGWSVPTSSMQPGDLIIFNNGGHVGIYAGNGRMIQEGGGLGRVGYLTVSPGSYWYNHISAVKRMF